MIENASAKSASWITTGGGLPVFNSQAFSKKDSKICKSRPNSVLNVPPEEDEKEVKISRTPLVLKYLKNNWIWHNKNGMEKDAASTSRKKKDYASRAYDREVRRRMRHIRTPDPEQLEAEVQPREPSPGLLEFIASSEAQQGSNNSLGVGQERSQIRQRRMHSDFLIRELESQQQDGITGNSVLVSQEQPVEVEHMDMEQQPKAGIQSMAARAMEVEEDSLNTAISTDASSSTSASMPTTSAAVFANKRRTRRTNNAEQMRHANANVNDDDIESANVEQEMPPKKIVRTNQQN